MLKLKQIAAGVIGMCVMSAASTAWAGPIFWTPSSGTTTQVIYSDGQSDKGLYGNPTVSGATFAFLTPHDFDASASNGSGETTSDRLSFKATAVAGNLSHITISEFGDWSILGGPSAVKDTGALFVTSLDPATFGTVYSLTPTVTYHNDLTNTNIVSPTYPGTNGSGTWSATYSLTLPAGIHSVQVVLNNVLQATAASGATSLIQKKGINISLIDPAVPEPAMVGVLAISGITLLRRRRSNA